VLRSHVQLLIQSDLVYPDYIVSSNNVSLTLTLLLSGLVQQDIQIIGIESIREKFFPEQMYSTVELAKADAQRATEENCRLR